MRGDGPPSTVNDMTPLIGLGITFWFISLSGALSPGPLTTLAIVQGARGDRWSGIRLAVGHGIPEGLLVLALAYGLGTWLRHPLIGGLIGLAGGGLLLWMGYGLITGVLQGRLSLAKAQSAVPTAMRLGPVAAGVLLSLSNPYWSLWWATVGTRYIIRASSAGLIALCAFYLLAHWTTDLAWLSGLSWATAAGRRWLGERAYRLILLTCGLFLVAMSGVFVYGGWRLLQRF